MRPRAIFFDLDDTLVDGVTARSASWESVCQDYALRLRCEADALSRAIRKHSDEFFKDEEADARWRLAEDQARAIVVTNALAAGGWDQSWGLEIAQEYARRKHEIQGLFDDVVEMLEALRRAGYRLGIITNGRGARQRATIDRHDLARHMDVIVIEGEFGKGKPEREVFEHALAMTGSKPGEAWHIGDELYADVGGAKAAGIHAVWIHRERLELREDIAVRPDRVIAHLRELHEELL